MNPTLTIIIPAYNEEMSLSVFLPEVIDFCRENSFELIVVNDGSKDGTGKLINSLSEEGKKFSIIHHKVNKGYGGAIKSGINVSKTTYVITIDADGQHVLSDVKLMFDAIIKSDSDMIVGKRMGKKYQNIYRSFGKWIIRTIAKWLVQQKIQDLNSGMKIYNRELAQKYVTLCPDSMAYSDIITLIFVSQKHLVKENPIQVRERTAGKSTISTKTAIETVFEIMNIVVLFNPMRIFFPLSVFFILFGLVWGIPIMIKGNGVSAGTFLTIITGILFFLLGLIAEQLSMLRKGNIK